MITSKQAKKMEGTEFDYIFPDGDYIRAYVKKFDAKVGLTCISLETKTVMGEDADSLRVEKEDDGTFCVIAFDFKVHKLKDALEKLTEIKNTGACLVEQDQKYIFNNISCAFM